MMSQRLENLRLVLIRDQSEPIMWLDRWALSYPVVHHIHICAKQSIIDWQTQLSGSLKNIAADENLMLVAHGAGANALAAWYFTTDTAMQKRILATILVAPLAHLVVDDEYHTFERVRFNCPTAWVSATDDDLCPLDWAQKMAQNWRAKHLISPHSGHLNAKLDGWQWGMKLMQEMLLSLE